MFKRFYQTLLILCVPFISSQVLADSANIESGKQLFESCVSCHGENGQGNEQLKAPALAGQFDWYLSKQIIDFQQGKRAADSKDVLGQQMVPMANLLTTAEQVANVSAYLASLPTSHNPDKATDVARSASNKYNAICGACHGKDAKGNKALKAPNLAILSKDYLTRQISNFKVNLRGYHDEDKLGKQMKMMANTLRTDQDVSDVVAFIVSQ